LDHNVIVRRRFSPGKSLPAAIARPGRRAGAEENSFSEEWVFAISFSGKKFIHFKPLNEKIFVSA
jgi:hypothetical protein